MNHFSILNIQKHFLPSFALMQKKQSRWLSGARLPKKSSKSTCHFSPRKQGSGRGANMQLLVYAAIALSGPNVS